MLSRTFVCKTHWITRKQLYRGRLRSTTHRQLMQDVKQVKMIATLFIKKKMMTTYSMARKPICSWYREIQNHYIRYIKTQNKSATLSMRHIKKKNPIHKWMTCGKITTYLRLELWHWLLILLIWNIVHSRFSLHISRAMFCCVHRHCFGGPLCMEMEERNILLSCIIL